MPAHRLEVLFQISTMLLLSVQPGDDMTHQIGTASHLFKALDTCSIMWYRIL
jgi:hypothetical protein